MIQPGVGIHIHVLEIGKVFRLRSVSLELAHDGDPLLRAGHRGGCGLVRRLHGIDRRHLECGLSGPALRAERFIPAPLDGNMLPV